MKNIYKYLIVLILGGLLSYFIFKKDTEFVEVPIKIEVPVPVIEKEFDTIYLPSEIKKSKPQIDSIYYRKFLKLKDSVAKDSAYKEAITIKEYRPRFEDDSIIIDVYAKTRGSLLESQVKYKTKPRNITLDTTITIEVPRQAKLYVGGQVYGNTSINVLGRLGAGPTGMLLNKKQTKIYNIGYDAVNKTWSGGVVFKL